MFAPGWHRWKRELCVLIWWRNADALKSQKLLKKFH